MKVTKEMIERAALALRKYDAEKAQPFDGFSMTHCREWATVALNAVADASPGEN